MSDDELSKSLDTYACQLREANAKLIYAAKARIEALRGEVDLIKTLGVGAALETVAQKKRAQKAEAEAEALRGEVARLKDAIEYNSRNCIDTMNKMREQHAAEVARLKGALDQTGDAICDVLEQMVRGSWQDSMNHPVANNVAMLKLKDALVTLAQRKALAGETT